MFGFHVNFLGCQIGCRGKNKTAKMAWVGKVYQQTRKSHKNSFPTGFMTLVYLPIHEWLIFIVFMWVNVPFPWMIE